MATNQLRHAYEQAEKLSLKYQDMIADKILEEIEEARWEKWLSLPETDAYFDKLEEELKADIRAGRIVKHIPGKSLAELFQQ